GGPLERFARDEVRVVMRPTRTYSTLLDASFHPDVLRSALARDRLLDRLWAGVDHSPYLARVLPAERRDLERGDVPRFTTRPGSGDLWTSPGERLKGGLPETGLVQARRRLGRMGDEDLDRQLWLVRASLATLDTGPGASLQLPRLAGAPAGEE